MQITSQDLLTALSPSLNPAWTAPSTAGSVSSFSLPPHTLLLLADVDAGSNTPSMVGKVLAWKKANPDEAERVWAELGRSNGKLRDSFAALTARAAEDPSAYEAEAARLAGLPASEVRLSSARDGTVLSRQADIALAVHSGLARACPLPTPSATSS